jgi:hypothetical protein
MLCLRGITILVDDINTDLPGLPREISSQVRQAWPDMYPWVAYALDHYLVRLHDDIPSIISPEHGLTYNIVDMLSCLSKIPNVPHAIGDSRGFMKLIAQVWLTSTSWTLGLLENLNEFLDEMIGPFGERTGPQSWVDQFEETVKSSTLDVGRPLISGIASLMQSSRPSPTVLGRHLASIYQLSAGMEEYPQFQSLLRNRSVYWVSRVVCRMTEFDYTESLSDEEAWLTADTLAFAYMHLYSSYEESFLYVAEALSDSGFLYSILSMGFFYRVLRQEGKDFDYLDCLLLNTLKTIRVHLVILPVLRRAIRCFRVVEYMEGEFEDELAEDAPKIWAAWISFNEEMKKRESHRSQYIDYNKRCDNVQV